MSSAARAYDYDAYTHVGEAVARKPRRVERTRSARPFFTVIGGKPANLEATLAQCAPGLLRAAKISVAVALALCLVALLRVGLSAGAISVMMSNNDLKAQIAQEQVKADGLEVQYSVYASPSRIQNVATGALGMVAPTSVAELDVSSSAVVAQNKKGNPELLAVNAEGAAQQAQQGVPAQQSTRDAGAAGAQTVAMNQ